MADRPLGQIAVDLGWITAEQRDAALALQTELRRQDLFMRIGEILARRAILPQEQVRALLDRQGITIVRCRSCGRQYNARNWTRGRGACACGGELDLGPPESPLSVSGNAAMQQLADAAPGKPPPETGALRGRHLGRYPLLEELGRGAMGLVYKAWDTGLGRPIAIKVLLDRGGPGDAVDRRHQFLQEARAVARLRHPSIVSVHESGQADGQGYYTMDFIDGAPLSALVREDRGARPVAFENSERPLPHVIEWMRDIATALQHAHQNGVLHCDVKPGNILIDRRNRALLSDFSSARPVRFAEDDPNGRRVLGTVLYMSPEQARGAARDVGIASDVWGVGAVLYVLLTGRHPFEGEKVLDLRKSICVSPIVPPRALNPAIPKPLEAIVMKCLRKPPSERYATAKDVADDLGRYLAGETVKAPLEAEGPALWKDRRVWIAVGVGAALLAALLGVRWILTRGAGRPAPYALPE